MYESRFLTTPSIFGISAGVGLILLAVVALLTGGGGSLGPESGQQALEERFVLSLPLPGDFEVTDARQLSGSELYITLAAPGERLTEPEPLAFEGNVAPKQKPSHGRPSRSWDPRNQTEWKRVAMREAGKPPVEAAFLMVEGREKADALLLEQFGRIRFKDLEDVGGQGEAIPIDSGTIDWSGYEATWVHFRHYELTRDRTPTCHDTLRVNLTTTTEARVLYLRWPRTYPGGGSAVEGWLSALSPKA